MGAFSPPGQAAISLEECRLESDLTATAVSARCGWYEVAENRNSAAGKRIRIRTVVVPALRRQALPDPVFIISGGPGQGAGDFYLGSLHAFERLRRDRDLVIVDQRGTGESKRLDCALPDELESARFDPAAIKRYTQECLAKLPGDPRVYSTSVAVRDLDDIRAGLGYEKINVYGISYGTRVAQHYLRRYPGRVRAIVLDGVVPTDVALGPEVAPAAQSALDAILNRCLSQNDCRRAFPEIKGELSQLRDDLSRHSVSITIPDPRTAHPVSLEFGYMHLATALRIHSYSDETASLLPFLIHEAAHGRPQAMGAQALLVSRDLTKQLANGMHNAVVCTEDVPFITQEQLRDSAIDRSYLRRYFVDTLEAMCSVWPRGEIDADFHAPIQSDTPALLLSGANDPITPLEYGERAARGFKNSKHIVVAGQGHGQLNNPCVSRIMSHFVEDGTPRNLDVSCIEKQGAAPFMLDATSPGP